MSSLTGLFIVGLIVLVSFAFLVIGIFLFIRYVRKQNENINERRNLMQVCERRISDLLNTNKNTSHKKQLSIILESIKFSDKVGVSSVDEKIVGAILILEKELPTESPTVNNVLEDLISLITQRNSEISDAKRGGF